MKPSAKSPSVVSAEVGLAEAADLIGKTQQWVRELVKQGYVQQIKRGRYRLSDVAQGALKFGEDDRRRNSKAAGANRISDARARKIEMELAKEENRLVETDRALAIIDDIVGIYRTGIGALPARATRDLVVRRRIEDECDAIQREVAKALAQRAEALQSGDASLDTVAEIDP